jgi:hypothetical protein
VAVGLEVALVIQLEVVVVLKFTFEQSLAIAALIFTAQINLSLQLSTATKSNSLLYQKLTLKLYFGMFRLLTQVTIQ